MNLAEVVINRAFRGWRVVASQLMRRAVKRRVVGGIPVSRYAGRALVLAGLLGCDEKAPREPQPPGVRDSVGVRIVESDSLVWDLPTGWTIATEPRLSIGVSDGDPDYQLFRVQGARRLPDGRVFVVNGGSNEIRFYDEHGQFERAVGGAGAGPGEFRALMWAAPYRGDSIAAFDAYLQQRRVSIFDGDGTFARLFAVAPDSGSQPDIVGVFPDGSFLGTSPMFGNVFERMRDPQTLKTGIFRPPRQMYRISPNGVIAEALPSVAGTELVGLRRGNRFTTIPRPLGSITSISVYKDGYVVTSGESLEVRVFQPDGSLAMIARNVQPTLPLTNQMVRTFLDEKLASASDEESRQFLQRVFRELPRPNTLPAITDIEVDEEGSIWVADHQMSVSDSQRWHIFGVDGTSLGMISIERGLKPLHIGGDFILMLRRDDDAVEYVELFPLFKEHAA